VNGCSYTLSPSSGTLAGKVIVTLDGPREVRIEIDLDERSDRLSIESTVTADDGKQLPFTTNSIAAIARRVNKAGTRATNELNAMRSELAQLNDWINSPGPQALAARNNAIARRNTLQRLIPDAESAVAGLEAEAAATKELLAFLEVLQAESAIVIETMPPPDDE
jgi:hypothetical protein